METERRLWIDTDTASDDAIALYTAELFGVRLPAHAGAVTPLV